MKTWIEGIDDDVEKDKDIRAKESNISIGGVGEGKEDIGKRG